MNQKINFKFQKLKKVHISNSDTKIEIKPYLKLILIEKIIFYTYLKVVKTNLIRKLIFQIKS